MSAVLTSPIQEVTCDPTPHSFPGLLPGETSTVNTPFRISTSPLLVCGTNVPLVLRLVTLDNRTFEETFQVNSQASGLAAPLHVDSANVPLAIPDLGTIESSVTVAGVRLPLGKVTVSVYITHQYDQDLRFSLVAPDGTEVLLSANNGQSGQNYGAGCNNMTVFSDDATVSIRAGLAPFLGAYVPEQPLAGFAGKIGNAVNGVWKLRVSDQNLGDVGTLQCWSLTLSPITCFDGGGQCMAPPVITQNPVSIVVTNGGTAALSVQATGTAPLSYQWYFNGGILLAGATSATLVLSPVVPTEIGSYEVTVNNLYGSVTSAPASVVMTGPPTLIGWFRVGDGPAWNTAPPCYTAREAAALLFGGMISQYAISTDPSQINLLAWVDGWGDPTYLSTPASEDFKGGVLYNGAGSYSAYVADHTYLSPNKTNYVWSSASPNIVGQPQNLVAFRGGTATFRVAAIGAGSLSYQWYFNGTNVLAGATGPTLVLNPVAQAQAGNYSVAVNNPYGGVTSALANLAVVEGQLPTLTCGSNRTVEAGTAWNFDTPTATGTNVTVTVVGTVTNLGCGLSLSATRTWVATDIIGNQATCSQTVTVVDTTPPVISCSPSKIVAYGSNWTFDTPTANDPGAVESLVYDNSRNDLVYRFNPGSLEVGNEIILADAARQASEFSFEFWGYNTGGSAFQGNAQARVRFYRNDGPLSSSGYPSPGTVIYDSGSFPISATPAGRATLIFDEFQIDAVVPLRTPLPDWFTWTVQFSGLGANDFAGVDLYAPPVVGNTYTDYWENDTSYWTQKTNAVPMEFAARLYTVNDGVNLTVLSTVTNAPCGNGFSATRTWLASDPCGNNATCSQTVHVVDQGPPVIVSQPESITVAAGRTASLQVSAQSCAPLSYQWYFNGNPLAGATNSTLALNQVGAADAGAYRVVIANTFGSVTSASAIVTVVVPPPPMGWYRVGDGPSWSTVPPCYSGRDAAVLLFGGALSQYAISTDPGLINLMAWVDGWGDPSHLATPVSEDFKGGMFYNSAGSYSAYVGDHTYLSLYNTNYVWYAVAPMIVGQPVEQISAIGGAATFQVSAIGAPNLAYQWYSMQRIRSPVEPARYCS